MKSIALKCLVLCLIALSLSGCDQMKTHEDRITELTIVLPNDFEGVFRIGPGSGGDTLPAVKDGESNIWKIPEGGEATAVSTRILADPTLQIDLRYEDGRALPNYNLSSPREAPPGVFKLYTETAGDNYWLVGTVAERNRALALGKENLELGKPLSEIEEAKAELDPLEF